MSKSAKLLSATLIQLIEVNTKAFKNDHSLKKVIIKVDNHNQTIEFSIADFHTETYSISWLMFEFEPDFNILTKDYLERAFLWLVCHCYFPYPTSEI